MRLHQKKSATEKYVVSSFMLDRTAKNKIIAKFKTHPTDTGSSEVQIAILTHEINDLIKHLQIHRKDFSSRTGLIKKVGQRRGLLRFLECENLERFQALIKKLKIRYKTKTPAIIAIEEEIAAEGEVKAEIKENSTED